MLQFPIAVFWQGWHELEFREAFLLLGICFAAMSVRQLFEACIRRDERRRYLPEGLGLSLVSGAWFVLARCSGLALLVASLLLFLPGIVEMTKAFRSQRTRDRHLAWGTGLCLAGYMSVIVFYQPALLALPFFFAGLFLVVSLAYRKRKG